MKTMSRAEAVAIVFAYAFNFAIEKAKRTIEDAIDALPYDRLGWWEMQEVYRNTRKELVETESFYLWGVAGIDSDGFTVAKWQLGGDFVNERVREMLAAITCDTLESLGQAKLEHKQREAKRENVDQ